tara:strand:+ start:212302 stop:213543 length:1242 start_codon:yes stop_codon:yes gene_type:complete
MKSRVILLFISISFGLLSCDNDDDSKYADYLVARPLTISTTEFKNGVSVLPPKNIEESGKIYAYKNYIFVNDKSQGIHVIDNRNPNSPKKITYIKIPGNVDISVKNDFLYADSLTDLVVIDISNIDNIRVVNRLENVLSDNVVWPIDVDFFEYEDLDSTNEILIGWETVTERRLIEDYEKRFGGPDVFFEAALNDASVGQGGSLARFKIVADYLYAVDSHNINVFGIQDLENPEDLEDVYAGFDIETIFNLGDNLFLGSKSGMYIYDISTPATPTYVSEFQHGTACDPVVADENYAYVTLRGGNSCGATESELLIIDIKDLTNPNLVKSYAMDGPYGLGIKEDKIFICDGASGLKVYNKADVQNLVALNQFKDINTFDVIPLENSLLMIGDEVLYQYEYLENEIKLMSTLVLK